MLKVHSYAISFKEFPNEIALCLNISCCPNRCKGCSTPELWADTGEELSSSYLDSLLEHFKDYNLTVVGLMGGDNDLLAVKEVAKYIKDNYNLKVGFYSGLDYLDIDLFSYLDYYKYGRYIMPQGEEKEWYKRSCGSIIFPWSNQRILKIEGEKLIDITEELRKEPLNNLSSKIIET